MRVLFLNYEYPPLGGGAANATSYLLKEYANIPDLKVDLVTSGIGSKYEREKIGDNIWIHKLPIGKNEKNLHFQSQKDLLVYSWKAYFFSRKLLRQREYNLIHAFFSVPCGFLALLFKWRYKIPYIVSLRGADVPGYSDRFALVYKFLTPLIRLVWKNADEVISNSEGLKELARKTSPNQKIGIIFNGVDTEKFQSSKEMRNLQTFKVLCISRLTARKGIGYLIEAIGILCDKYPFLKLKIVGEGDSKVLLEKQTEELGLNNTIEFRGRVRHDRLPGIYSGSHVFVLPSLNEGMSNTMLEALSSGLPIVATNTGGTKELVEDGLNGFIVRMKNKKDIADKLEKLMLDRDLCQRMGAKSREKAEKMSWKSVANEYMDVYREIFRSAL
jgi:glycosyltransferase involved in cell wall biosynthesis